MNQDRPRSSNRNERIAIDHAPVESLEQTVCHDRKALPLLPANGRCARTARPATAGGRESVFPSTSAQTRGLSAAKSRATTRRFRADQRDRSSELRTPGARRPLTPDRRDWPWPRAVRKRAPIGGTMWARAAFMCVVAGLAAAAFVGCGSDDEENPALQRRMSSCNALCDKQVAAHCGLYPAVATGPVQSGPRTNSQCDDPFQGVHRLPGRAPQLCDDMRCQNPFVSAYPVRRARRRRRG